MKNKYISLLALFAMILTLTVSCESDDPAKSDATPTIKYVRPTDAARADSLLVEASMGSTIALIGEGLEGVNEIWFNDQRAKLNPVYITSTSIIVTVPGTMPEEISNTITLKTAKGKQSKYDFAVIIPSPRVTGMKNEWAADGMETTIFGDYFFPGEDGKLVEILFPGNLTAEVISFDERNIRIKVPAGALPGTVTVESIYGKGRSEFTFRNNEGLFIDSNNPEVWNTWNRSAFATEGGTSGQYVLLSGQSNNWAWPPESMQVIYINPTGNTLATVPGSEPSDYALVFEYNSINWSGCHMYIWFGGAGGDNIDAPERVQYLWQPFMVNGTATNLVTGEWVTVSIPLSEFNHNKASGSNDAKYSSIDELINMYIFVFGAADAPAPFELWMDNFRLVKIN